MKIEYLKKIVDQMIADQNTYKPDMELSAADWLFELGACMLNNLEVDETKEAKLEIVELGETIPGLV